ncbi:1-acyl-sn-glycerol-3-phosphate acyltransferase [bacterium]|nr:1-acyl-sn-glycerol-3-phosphate acyltransferase [bacterium]
MSEKNFSRLYEKDFNKQKYWFQIFSTDFIFSPMLKIFYKISVTGRENIPQNSKFICAPNHISYLDPHSVFYAVRKPIAYMAKKELFETKFMQWVLPKLAAFSVNREKLEVSTIKTVRDVMKTKDWNLCIFPQGGIFKNKKIEKINRGFIVIAKMSKIDILPMSITGTEKYNWIPLQGRLDIKIGKPISWQLPDEEIFEQWAEQVSSMANYEYVKEETSEKSLVTK